MSRPIEDHFDRLSRLLDSEREAEKEENKRELERFPIATREALGKTVARLTIDGMDVGAGGYSLLVLSRPPRGEELAPFHGMNQGDNVRVQLPPGSTPASLDGTLERVEEYRAWVAVQSPPPERLPEGRCMVDLLGSDATYRRMKKALAEAAKASGNRTAELRDALLGLLPAVSERPAAVSFFNPSLNEFQRQAVRSALAARDAALVHGPPGTGKTTVLVEIIRQAAAQGLRVLASAPSNIAVDNMLEKLLPDLERPSQGPALRVARLGHPARTLEALRHGNLRVQMMEDPQYAMVQEIDAWRERLAKRLARTGGRGLGFEERGAAQAEVKRLWREARNVESAIERRLVQSAQVILCTHGGISSKTLRGSFDLVILDEASQATEPLSWIAVLRGKKAVFAGDAMQLPPTLYSKDAAQGGLALTLFERLKGVLAPSLQTLLRVQYRMHESIMGFSSGQFYEGKLIAHESVRAHLANEIAGVQSTELTSAALVFVDTAGTGYEESFNEFLQSRENKGEATLAARLLSELLDSGLKPRDVALLTPYVAQVKLLKTLVRAPGVEIGTVDGFQGREKEATIVSLVRSNERGEVGFLSDTRRMNVAVTRARRLLLVIGDSATISHHPFYRAFLDYTQKNGSHRSAWEWLPAAEA